VTKLVLDCNIWDKLGNDAPARARIRALCEAGSLTIIVPHTLVEELAASPFAGVPDWFPVAHITDSVFIFDHSRLDSARLGDGEIFAAHRGKSQQIADAVLVDAADTDADIFVSEDRRARKHYAELRDAGRSLNYARFRAEILGL
jgi:hypothetical protein